MHAMCHQAVVHRAHAFLRQALALFIPYRRRLIMAPNGTLYISDLGNDGTVVWSNELLTNRSATTCSPYSLSVLTSGVLIERDCQNRTVWVMPNLAGKQALNAGGSACSACSINKLTAN
jgi:hypothetical protein